MVFCELRFYPFHPTLLPRDRWSMLYGLGYDIISCFNRHVLRSTLGRWKFSVTGTKLTSLSELKNK